MNCKEHHLPELELGTGQVREALQCLLHTILFIRAPGPVAPRDVHMEDFDLTYTRIASVPQQQASRTQPGASSGSISSHVPAADNDVDQKVDDAIDKFLQSLTPIGPELLQGCINLSFFERRSSRQLFGLVSHEERVTWETWVIRVVVNTTPRPVSDDTASVMERQRIQDTAERMLKAALLKIFDGAGESLDHLPPVMYEFEIKNSSKRADDRENMRTRVTNMPKLINLGT